MLADANRIVDTLRKDVAALFVANRFNQIVRKIRLPRASKRPGSSGGQPTNALQVILGVSPIGAEGSDIELQSQESTKSKVGVGAETQTYDILISECPAGDKEALKKNLQRAKNRGQRILYIREICGHNRPLWMFFPTRKMLAPADPSITVTPTK